MWRARGILAAGLVCASAVVAAEQVAGTAPDTPSPIEAAKRDYDAIKDAKFSLEQQKLDLPKTATPELRMINESGAGELGLAASGRRPKDKAHGVPGRGQRGTNWLVDAMQSDKDKSGKPGATDTLLPGETDGTDPEDAGKLNLVDLAAKKPAMTNTLSRRTERTTAPEEKPAAQIANPLDGFLAGWMTPGDYQLLKAAPEAGRTGAPAPPSPANPTDVAGFRGFTPLAGHLVPSPAEPRVNPYLSESQRGNFQPIDEASVSLPSGVASAPMPPPPPSTPVAAGVEIPAPKPTAAAAASELIKARDDAKYFPQLKRF